MQNNERIERRIYIGASPEKVWDAILTPETASQYFVVPLIESDARTGGKLVYGAPGSTPEAFDVLECDPGKKLVHTFSLSSFPDDPPTRVIYELEPMGGMTKLTLIHDGFPAHNDTFKSVNGGWDLILCSLKTLVETGTALPRPPGRAGME